MKKRTYVYFTYLLIVSLIVTAVSFSKYSTTVENSAVVSVAKPVVKYVPVSLTYNGNALESSGPEISLSDIRPGDELIFHFQILNYDGVNRNQVLMKYLISVIFEPEALAIPLDYTLVPDPDSGVISAGDGWTFLGFDADIVHSWTLTASWDANQDGSEYTNQEQEIQIRIDSQQVDSMP